MTSAIEPPCQPHTEVINQEQTGMSAHPLIDRANCKTVNQVTGFAAAAAQITAADLRHWYETERESAPRRSSTGKNYFVDHDGSHKNEHFGPNANSVREGRKEEHLATALFNDFGYESGGLPLPDQGLMRFLDYQVPLKSKQADSLIGKVDLLARVPGHRLAMVELKYMPVTGTVSSADTPLRAFLEGLAYCAILEADIECLCKEAGHKFNFDPAPIPPALIVLANADYWQKYAASKPAGVWKDEMLRLAEIANTSLNVPTSFLSLSISEDPITYDKKCPRFNEVPELGPAW
jgi:hypothetical protein